MNMQRKLNQRERMAYETVARLEAERDALQQLLNARDQEIDRLKQSIELREEMIENAAIGWPIVISTAESPLRVSTCGRLLCYSHGAKTVSVYDPDRMTLMENQA